MDLHRWAIVLAAGQGRRLQALTRVGRRPVPKQFCSLDDDVSLLHGALRRASRVVRRHHVVPIVARQHRRWFEPQLADFPSYNVIVQPSDRGTAAGVLLPLLHILDRDPEAEVLVLPSDHFVGDEAPLARAMNRALAAVRRCRDCVVLIGVRPRGVDADLGWIVPRGKGRPAGAQRVERFREKPPRDEAESLFAAGAAVNTFIFAARGDALLELYRERLPELWYPFGSLRRLSGAPLAALYRTLPARDFSRHLLEPAADRLRLLTVPDCRWSDLGTPQRIAACLDGASGKPRAAIANDPLHVPLRLSTRLTEARLAS